MANTTTKKHPIRGFLYGIVFGLGLAMIAIGQGWAALGTWPPVIIFVVGIIVGTVWSTFGPAKAPKGPEPAAATEPDPEPDPEPPAAEVGAAVDDTAGDLGDEGSGPDTDADANTDA